MNSNYVYEFFQTRVYSDDSDELNTQHIGEYWLQLIISFQTTLQPNKQTECYQGAICVSNHW